MKKIRKDLMDRNYICIKSLNVLLSSFNGSKYLPTQIDTILNQACYLSSIELFVRDDGSKDNSVDLLKSAYNLKVNLSIGQNIGVVSSFLELLTYPNDNVEFVAFSDQDDYWQSNKLERAVTALIPFSDVPALYCSRLSVVDNNLKHLFYSKVPRRNVSLRNALAENIATGCTIVINQLALKLLRENMPDPKKLVMHDWWFYLVISALGKIVYDPEPTILYRQHGNNVEGMKSGLAKLKAKFRNITRPPKYVKVSTQVAEFKRCYYQMLSNEQKKLVDDFLLATSGFNIWKKLKLILSGRVYRQTKTETLSFLISMLLNRI